MLAALSYLLLQTQRMNQIKHVVEIILSACTVHNIGITLHTNYTCLEQAQTYLDPKNWDH